MSYKDIPTYDECMNLVKDNDPNTFIFKDEIVDGVTITTFHYMITPYEFFTQYGARNMRGITFKKDTKELIALPFHKFFNFNENPLSDEKEMKNKKINRTTEKMDGSLIYFFMINNKLYAKTKLNCNSDQSVEAMKIVESNQNLKNEIIDIINNGYTPMFEYISPFNQIVILYTTQELIYLGSRSMKDGSYDFEYKMTHCKNVEHHNIRSLNDAIEMIKKYDGHEGVVITFEDQDMVKIKTDEYINLHSVRENIFNDRSLAQLILDDKIDDVKSIFKGSQELISHIEEREKKIKKIFFDIINTSKEFYENNKELSRKDFAIKAKEKLDGYCFSTSLSMYLNNFEENKIKEIIIRKKLWEN